MAHPNIDLVRTFFDAVVAKDQATLQSMLAEDFVGHMTGNNALSGTYKGLGEFFGAMQKADELTGGLERELHDVTASDDHAVALVSLRVQKGGKTITWNGANIWHIKAGKLTELWLLSDDPAATDEAFS